MESRDACPLDTGLQVGFELNLPWEDFSHYNTAIVKDAWKDGSHPLGVEVTLFGPQNGAPHHTLAAAWGAHLPRLNYEFQSSVSGMEIGYRGGFVGTNHPEYQADVLILHQHVKVLDQD